MKINNSSQFGFTEKEMADAFMEVLQSPNGLPDIGSFDEIYREIIASRGQPDFIALRYKNENKPPPLFGAEGLIGPTILAILKPKAPRTLDYLTIHSGFLQSSVKRSLQRLISVGYVEQTKTGSYHLGNAAIESQPELWSFELKLNNPKRAVFQAQQSRSFADRSVIVVPNGQEKNYKRYTEAIKRWNIGLATFDPRTGLFFLLGRLRKTRAYNRQHKFHTINNCYGYIR